MLALYNRPLVRMREPFAVQWSRAAANTWPVNVFEDADSYRIFALLPGVNPDEIEITAHPEGYLTIAGTVKPQFPEEWRPVWSEWGESRFQRAIRLPLAYNADEAKVGYENGVLAIELPKAPEAKPKQIRVTNGVNVK